MHWTPFDLACMQRALALAERGRGFVEPNPMVGCVLANAAQSQIVAEGWHRKFGGPHAEVEAIARANGLDLNSAVAYITLEPCCHTGKTPPCTEALLKAGIGRVVAALRDPFPQVAGGGFEQLRRAGIEVEVGCLEEAARALNAPYFQLVHQQRPWMIGKWAMSLDGKIATRTGHSQWIASPTARARVHAWRGEVDAILVGGGTAKQDDPLLTARPPGPRIATRIVLDSQASLSPGSQLAQTARDVPVLLVASQQADAARIATLQQAGCEVLLLPSNSRTEQWQELLMELGRRRMTNVLVEGGGEVLGSLWDAHLLNEVRVFLAPRLIGGAAATSPLTGLGCAEVPTQPLKQVRWETVGEDMLCIARI